MHANKELASVMGADRALVYQYIVTALEIANIGRDDRGYERQRFCKIDMAEIASTLGQKLNCVKKNITKLIKDKFISVYKVDREYICVVINSVTHD